MSGSIKVAIPSYGRPERVVRHPLLQYATLVVPQAQRAAYEQELTAAGVWPDLIVTHPDLIGVVPTRNWILDNVWDGQGVLLMMDDDIEWCYALMTTRQLRTKDPERCLAIVEQTAQVALDSGTAVFGYAHSTSPLRRSALEPFGWRQWVTTEALGLTPAARGLRFDRNLIVAEDKDISLQSLERTKLCLCDQRFRFDAAFNIPGGLTGQRTAALTRQSAEHLVDKWGPAIVMLDRDYTGPSDGVRLSV